MAPARGGWQPSGRMERMPSPPGLPFPRHPFVGPVDSLPETLWREIDNLVPPSLSLLLPALNEEHGGEAVMKRIPPSTFKPNGLSFCVYFLDRRSTDRTPAAATQLGAQGLVQTGHRQ